MSIYMTARFRVKRHAIEKCRQALKDLVAHVRENEPRTIVYLAQQEIADPSSFLSVLIFENEAGLLMHQNSPASAQFVDTVYPETLAPIEFTEYNVVADRNE